MCRAPRPPVPHRPVLHVVPSCARRPHLAVVGLRWRWGCSPCPSGSPLLVLVLRSVLVGSQGALVGCLWFSRPLDICKYRNEKKTYHGRGQHMFAGPPPGPPARRVPRSLFSIALCCPHLDLAVPPPSSSSFCCVGFVALLLFVVGSCWRVINKWKREEGGGHVPGIWDVAAPAGGPARSSSRVLDLSFIVVEYNS